MDKVLAEIVNERKFQDTIWGREFDNHNKLNDWVTYITHYAAKNYGPKVGVEVFRNNMIKVAALAVAAVEACDRTHKV